LLLAGNQTGNVEIAGATPNFATDFAGCFNKKAQLDQTPSFFKSEKISFSGTRVKGKPVPQVIINKRAKRKGFSVALAKAMIKQAEEEKSPMLRSYYNALHCCDTLHEEDGKLISKYCKTRICVICGAIRTAKAIDTYFPIIKDWDSYFVTLTIPNVREESLRKTIDEMLNTFRNSQRAIKRKFVFKGIRKLEVTHNFGRNDYHGHFHVVVDGINQALLLRDEWMKRNPAANAIAQDVRKCNEGTLKEVFKYSMKILASDNDKSRDPHLHPHAVDVIVRALHKRRTYQNFGFKLKKEFDEDDFDGEALQAPSGEREEVSVWEWVGEAYNWVNKQTGELLSTYWPSKRRLNFLKKIEEPSRRAR